MSRGRVAVCTWSLKPESVETLVDRLQATGLRHLQLALDPVRTGVMELAHVRSRLREADLTPISGMMAMAGEDYSSLESIRRTGGVVPDETWPSNLVAAAENARIARDLGVDLVTFHAGFIPHESADPARAVALARIRAMREVFAGHGVRLALETGQETAETLSGVLAGLDGVGVNFDPANMILYGMGDPVAALHRLLHRVEQVHIKDAMPSAGSGEWGVEVPVGTGAVQWTAFLTMLRSREVDLVIEREAGTDRIGDVRLAADLLRAHGWPA